RVARADPAVGRRLMDATLELVRKGLVAGVQDMGAAGLSSSVAEAAHRASLGVDLDLDAVPVAHAGMDPVEIMLSETQERMLYVVTPDREGQVLELLARFDLEAAVVGRAAEHGQLRLQGGGRTLAEMPVSALNGAPAYRRPAEEDQAVLALRES